jgi:hypothetical protein
MRSARTALDRVVWCEVLLDPRGPDMNSEDFALWITTVAAVGSLALQVRDAWPEKRGDEPGDGSGAPGGEPLAPEDGQG